MRRLAVLSNAGIALVAVSVAACEPSDLAGPDSLSIREASILYETSLNCFGTAVVVENAVGVDGEPLPEPYRVVAAAIAESAVIPIMIASTYLERDTSSVSSEFERRIGIYVSKLEAIPVADRGAQISRDLEACAVFMAPWLGLGED